MRKPLLVDVNNFKPGQLVSRAGDFGVYFIEEGRFHIMANPFSGRTEEMVCDDFTTATEKCKKFSEAVVLVTLDSAIM